MQRGGHLLAASALVAVAACSSQGELQVRPAGRQLAAAATLPQAIAQGHAQLALGNPGLALELFRKALREDPASAEANAGIAMCYDRMNRFDLSRRYYEAALAIAPANTRLLERLAVSLDRQRKPEEAASVRREIAMRLAAADVASTIAAAEPAPAPLEVEVAEAAIPAAIAPPVAAAPRIAAPAIAPPAVAASAAIAAVPAPAAKPAPVARPVPVKVAPPPPPAPVVAPPAPVAPRPLARPVTLAGGEAPLTVHTEAPVPVAAATVTVALPPARPAEAPVAEVARVETPPAPAPAEPALAPAPVRPVAPRIEVARGEGPRLERMSRAEVVLVSRGAPRWRSQVVARNDRSTTIRYVPLKQSGPNVRLLNAARSQGLAAHTRQYLADMGWRRIAIGDAPETRETSIIYYPESRRRTAEVLAAQFRIRVARRVQEGSAIVMLLGRDAARTKARRTHA